MIFATILERGILVFKRSGHRKSKVGNLGFARKKSEFRVLSAPPIDINQKK
jgi:hypothetical protein